MHVPVLWANYVFNRHIKNNTPTLIIQGRKDELSLNEYVQKFMRIRDYEDRLYTFFRADHDFSEKEHRESALKIARDWIETEHN